ncbi:hypothetical protein [Candidatus Collinsella stercoripullorum]|uniref:hypothetical protein n=1 Tax=Candidatus Collinsella stercoripullorum TaxID=2838522 RepID=UPI0022E674B6|nr:hypothetical protein [Candidatus Collinsella stercoripullorum]
MAEKSASPTRKRASRGARAGGAVSKKSGVELSPMEKAPLNLSLPLKHKAFLQSYATLHKKTASALVIEWIEELMEQEREEQTETGKGE